MKSADSSYNIRQSTRTNGRYSEYRRCEYCGKKTANLFDIFPDSLATKAPWACDKCHNKITSAAGL